MKTILKLLLFILIPAVVNAKTVSINWDYNSGIGVSGFRLYNNWAKPGDPILCETKDPMARNLACPVDLVVGTNKFTLTAVDIAGNESAHSNAFNYTYVVPDIPTIPVANDLSISVLKKGTVSGKLTANGDVTKYSLVTIPPYGRLTLDNFTGNFNYTNRYTPPNMIDSFKFKASNNKGVSSPAVVTIIIK
jgi:hypothetical protein